MIELKAPNFSLQEFACPCCGLSSPSVNLVRVLQDARHYFGVPVIIHEGGGTRCLDYQFRCEKNHGYRSIHRWHTRNMAADIHAAGVEHIVLGEWLLQHPDVGGVIVYSWGVHVDLRPRKDGLAWLDVR